MSIEIFVITILVPIALVLGVLGYLRPVLRGVLEELGVSVKGVDFWATTLAVIGSVMLALLSFNAEQITGDFLRGVLMRSMFGCFAAVALTAKLVWDARPAVCKHGAGALPCNALPIGGE